MYDQIVTALAAPPAPEYAVYRLRILGVWQQPDGDVELTDFPQATRRLHNRITDEFDTSLRPLPFIGAAWGPDFAPALEAGLDLIGVALLAAPHRDAAAVHTWVACADGMGLHAAYGRGRSDTTVLTPDNTDRLHHPAINELEGLRADITGTEPVFIRWAHDCWPWQTCTKCGKRNGGCDCPLPEPPHHS